LLTVKVEDFQKVSSGLLNQKTGEILDRVMRDERLIICRHRRPIATLQPLDGLVTQPLEGRDYDITGSPLGSGSVELEKLPEPERALLLDAVSHGRLIPNRVAWDHDTNAHRLALESLVIRGLVKRSSSRGHVLTGRGLVLREELFVQAGRDPTDCWLR
jgi:antitoxin (DNA-binding transcriptional repressor) of toxin-antitoxin stability system